METSEFGSAYVEGERAEVSLCRKKKKKSSTTERIRESAGGSHGEGDKSSSNVVVEASSSKAIQTDMDSGDERDRSAAASTSQQSLEKSSKGKSSSTSQSFMTESEKRYDEVRRKRLAEKVRKEAQKSHKDRVSEFNQKLERMSEHHDMPRVSWRCSTTRYQRLTSACFTDWTRLVVHPLHGQEIHTVCRTMLSPLPQCTALRSVP